MKTCCKCNKDYSDDTRFRLSMCPKCYYDHSNRAEKDKEYYLKNKDKKVAWQREYYQNNKDKCNAWHREYYYKNTDLSVAKTNKRKAIKNNATPTWLSKDQLDTISAIYYIRKWLSDLTGNIYHVDHIIPLNGKTVSGLHVPWNLQIIPAKDNLTKSNKVVN